ncbi:hypothetical protein T484DRAFT_2870602 [Baffinella frigidus]|nr:hypothetical protein T484DRAFT_2870602 [Cryptophyta sp. CCMP2293]
MPPSQTPAGEKMRKQLVELVGKLQDEEHAHVKAQNELPTLDDGALKAAVAHKESTERVADLKSKLSVLQGIIKQRRPVLAKVEQAQGEANGTVTKTLISKVSKMTYPSAPVTRTIEMMHWLVNADSTPPYIMAAWPNKALITVGRPDLVNLLLADSAWKWENQELSKHIAALLAGGPELFLPDSCVLEASFVEQAILQP